MKTINSLVSGEIATIRVMVKSATVRLTKDKGLEYFDLVLCDKTGEIPAKIWNINSNHKRDIRSFGIFDMVGKTNFRDGRLQIIIDAYVPTDPQSINMSDFVKTSKIPANDLFKYLLGKIDTMSDGFYKDITKHFVSLYEDKLKTSPAAKSMHHAFQGGLLFHVCGMLSLCEVLVNFRPFLNKDLLRAGIILHDIAKIEEMEHEYGIVSDYSFRGKLLGHIPMVFGKVVEYCQVNGISQDSEDVILLQHLLLSHHNLKEWGSPVQPRVPEAVALHYIDQLDAKMQAVEDAIDGLKEGNKWTDKIPALEGESLYNHNRK